MNPASTTNFKILLVEDERSLREAMSMMLETSGYQVLQASDGKMGLDMALAEHPQLILLDSLMPVMNGLEMLTALRSDQWGATAWVILLTNLSDLALINNASALGVDKHIVKANFGLTEIIDIIEQRRRSI